MAVQSGLEYMRSRTVVDCDTMDEEGTSHGLHDYVQELIFTF